jgi:hypothetical protein
VEEEEEEEKEEGGRRRAEGRAPPRSPRAVTHVASGEGERTGERERGGGGERKFVKEN